MSKKGIYTIVLDYKGGTYIAQVTAHSPVAALPKWASKIKGEALSEWGITRDELAKIIKSDHVIPVDGCVNVWCTSGSTHGGLALVNVIATAESPEA